MLRDEQPSLLENLHKAREWLEGIFMEKVRLE